MVSKDKIEPMVKKFIEQSGEVSGSALLTCSAAATEQVLTPGNDNDSVRCAQCGKTISILKSGRLPEIGWCGCDNNSRTA